MQKTLIEGTQLVEIKPKSPLIAVTFPAKPHLLSTL
jgi:hypothetical protein